jgi:hypothetical protein
MTRFTVGVVLMKVSQIGESGTTVTAKAAGKQEARSHGKRAGETPAVRRHSDGVGCEKAGVREWE